MRRGARGALIAAVAVLALAVLTVAALHLFPGFEAWLHHVTGWY